MKIFQIGLCVAPEPFNEMQLSFIRHATEYKELNSGDKDLNLKAVAIAKEFKPDLVFMQIQAPNIIQKATVQYFKDNGAFVINWNGDLRASTPQWMKEIGGLCLTLFSNMRDVYEMRRLGFKSDYLEIGYNEHIYKPEGKIIPTNKIVFFANHYGDKMFPMSKYRREMVEYLKKRYPKDFSVYGNGWTPGTPNFNNSQPDEAAAYRGSLIAINCSHFEVERYNSDRIFRILGTGVPICLSKNYPGIDTDYHINVHLKVWNHFYELSSLIDRYLLPENKAEREIIAYNGMIYAQKNFTFDSMIRNIINFYNDSKAI